MAAGREDVKEEPEAVAVEATGKTEKPEKIDPYTLASGIFKFLYDSGILPRVCLEMEMVEILAKHIETELNGVTIGEEPEILRDWTAAENAVDDILSKYAPGGYIGKIIYKVVLPLKERLEAGERTPELYNAIVEATR